MYCVLKVYPSKCGDAISIKFLGADEKMYNIFIDGGYRYVYTNYLKSEIESIRDAPNETIDVWCISHVDSDHINGLLKFIGSDDFSDQEKDNLVSEYWFNFVPEGVVALTLIQDENTETGINQGKDLRSYLNEKGKLHQRDIIAGMTFSKGGSTFTILSPTQDELDAFKDVWLEEEKTETSKKDDYSKDFETLKNKSFEVDDDAVNGSSISFLWEYHDVKILFLADSNPETICESLTTLGYSETNKLKLNYVKVSHHGSGHNTNNELLSLIECDKFIICADGINSKTHLLPYKECLVRILHSNSNARLIFSTKKNDVLENKIFDADEKKKYGIKKFGYCIGEKPLQIKFESK